MQGMTDSGALRRDISRLLQQEREAAGLTHADLAARSGVAATSLSRIERGTLAPSIDNLEKIFSALGLRIRITVERAEADAELIDRDAWLPLSTRLEKSGLGQLLRMLDQDHVPYVIDGALAATMQGAPLPIEVLEVDVAWRDAGRFTGWLVRRLAYRWHEAHQEFRVHDLDPRAPGPHYWQTAIGRVRARMVDELPERVEIKVGDTAYQVRPIAQVGSDEEKTARAIDRFRNGTLTM
jgi:transcriptional regulator with XRE-family HTH domain